MRHLTLAAALLALAAPACTQQQPAPSPNTLTEAERQAGWALLFDGRTTSGWRGYQVDTMPGGWDVMDGALTRTGRGGDIITVREYADFELSLEWKIAPCGNSGVFYHVTEAEEATYHTGPEMQVLDDACHPDGRSRLTAAGSNFGLHAAPAGVVRPAGEWNNARLLVRGSHVEHWLNDSLMAEYELWSDDWEQRVQGSKFVEWPAYGRARTGHVALQDHGDTVSFRNIKLRELR